MNANNATDKIMQAIKASDANLERVRLALKKACDKLERENAIRRSYKYKSIA